MTDQPAPAVDAGPPSAVIPNRAPAAGRPGGCCSPTSGPYRWTLLGGGLLGFLGGLAALAQPLVAKQVVDTLGTGARCSGRSRC